jgi:hypothetical protein
VILITAIFIIGILSIAFAGIDVIQYNEDDIWPFVVRTDPPSGTTNVEPNFSLKIFFNEPMFQSLSVHNGFWMINTAFAETRWIDDQTVEVTNLLANRFGMMYVHFSGSQNEVRDLAGNSLAEQYNWSFSTRPINANILSYTSYHHSNSSSIDVYGEVKNQESFNISFLDIDIIAYDENNNEIGIQTGSTFTAPDIIKPNEIVPFIGFYPYGNGNVKDMDFEIENNAYIEYDLLYEGLEVINDQGSLINDDIGNYYVVNGTIINNGDQLGFWPIVTSIFYDSQNQILGVTQWILDIEEIDINRTADFEIMINEFECDVWSINSYSLNVYSYL